MASFTAGTTFVDGVSNDVTAAKLGNLVTNATPTSGFIQDRTAETVTATNDTLLIGDASDSNNLKRITVANFAQTLPTAKVTTGTIETGTFGTTTSTAATITTGTITTGVIPTLTTGTTTSTNEVVTNGTITNLSATTSTFLGAITASTNTIAIGSVQFCKDANGNVGIGESVPSSKFEVRSGGGSNAGGKATYEGAIKINETGLTTLGTTGGIEFKGSVFGSGYGSKILGTDDGQLLIGNRSNSASWTERVRIDSSGNVGIGTTGANAKLEVRTAVAKATTAVTNTINLASNDASNALTLELALGTNSTAASRYASIQSVESGVAYRDLLLNKDGGNVLVGTTTAVRLLTVAGTIYAKSSAAGTEACDLRNGGTAGTRNLVIFRVGASDSTVGAITSDGANTAYGTTSDYRLKINLEQITNGITRIKQLPVYRFNWISNPSGNKVDGFVAHEAKEIVPECVVGEKDAVDAEGNPVYQNIDQSKIVPLLTAALKEAISKIEILESKVAALEAA